MATTTRVRKGYRVKYRDIARKQKQVTFSTKKQAEQFVKGIEFEKIKLKERLTPEALREMWEEKADPTIREVFDYYREHKLSKVEKESAINSTIADLRGLLKEFGSLRVSQLTPRLVLEYQTKMLKKGLKQTTLHTYFAKFKAMLNWAAKVEFVSENPIKEVPIENGTSEEKAAFSEDQIRTFEKAVRLNGHLKILAYFLVGYNTGTRIAELFYLEPDEVDLEIRCLNLPGEKTKTNKPRRVPLNDTAFRVIQELYVNRDPDNPYVMPRFCGPEYITQRISILSQRYLGKKFTSHCFRITFATLALRGKRIKGADGKDYWVRGNLKSVAEIGGWEPNSKVLLKIYAKTDDEQMRATVDLVQIKPQEPVEVVGELLVTERKISRQNPI